MINAFRLLVIAAGIFIHVSKVHAEQVTVTVKGMVCSFCAQGIKKTFMRKDGVEKVDVDLDKKLVTIVTAQGVTLKDSELTESIVDSGYEVVSIERKPPAEEQRGAPPAL
jgi:copper chaperone CopZ